MAVLIMDEVDGMSAGDRGGVGAFMIEKSKVAGLAPSLPCFFFHTRITLIGAHHLHRQRPRAQELKPLVANTFSLAFQRSVPRVLVCSTVHACTVQAVGERDTLAIMTKMQLYFQNSSLTAPRHGSPWAAASHRG
ncbi:hypothetical protein B0H15DRAFT_311944 [Mycena belliarum]|uniref:Uncharacterized protein n=1 Tax=Mycena belliarum TaxID=1033014 RepID=A0AAD6UK70_9AGAR|nr:hypothetical protein B0H15DRAFT_311944 [Mycena belliae]